MAGFTIKNSPRILREELWVLLLLLLFSNTYGMSILALCS